MPYTKNDWVDTAKSAKIDIHGIHVPVIKQHYMEFSTCVDLDENQYPNLQAYIKKASYAEKRQVFEKLGFTVHRMVLDNIKLHHYLQGDNPTSENLDTAFIRGEKNLVIIDVTVGSDTLYWLLEYPIEGPPLRTFTIDDEKLKKEYERKARTAAFMMRKKT